MAERLVPHVRIELAPNPLYCRIWVEDVELTPLVNAIRIESTVDSVTTYHLTLQAGRDGEIEVSTRPPTGSKTDG